MSSDLNTPAILSAKSSSRSKTKRDSEKWLEEELKSHSSDSRSVTSPPANRRPSNATESPTRRREDTPISDRREKEAKARDASVTKSEGLARHEETLLNAVRQSPSSSSADEESNGCSVGENGNAEGSSKRKPKRDRSKDTRRASRRQRTNGVPAFVTDERWQNLELRIKKVLLEVSDPQDRITTFANVRRMLERQGEKRQEDRWYAAADQMLKEAIDEQKKIERCSPGPRLSAAAAGTKRTSEA